MKQTFLHLMVVYILRTHASKTTEWFEVEDDVMGRARVYVAYMYCASGGCVCELHAIQLLHILN